jgi:hypothetical protein
MAQARQVGSRVRWLYDVIDGLFVPGIALFVAELA